jgi:hypothetical protein
MFEKTMKEEIDDLNLMLEKILKIPPLVSAPKAETVAN